jgi:chemotaxis family two-component system response regulator Rcp1
MLLLVEDNPADVVLLKEALKESPLPVQLCVVADGSEALAFLHHEQPYQDAPRPTLILLDLNVPRVPGQAVLAQVKAEANLKQIPIIVLSGSRRPDDIQQSYELGANAYLQKPLEFGAYVEMVQGLLDFWCRRAVLPSATDHK